MMIFVASCRQNADFGCQAGGERMLLVARLQAKLPAAGKMML